MKNDIENRMDLEVLVHTFYERVKSDPTIGFYFTEVVAVKWEKHLPVMVDFWENVLFFTGNYQGNPMETHKRIHELQPFSTNSFDQWIFLFNATADELFQGRQAETIKQKAANIATILKLQFKTS